MNTCHIHLHAHVKQEGPYDKQLKRRITRDHVTCPGCSTCSMYDRTRLERCLNTHAERPHSCTCLRWANARTVARRPSQRTISIASMSGGTCRLRGERQPNKTVRAAHVAGTDVDACHSSAGRQVWMEQGRGCHERRSAAGDQPVSVCADWSSAVFTGARPSGHLLTRLGARRGARSSLPDMCNVGGIGNHHSLTTPAMQAPRAGA